MFEDLKSTSGVRSRRIYDALRKTGAYRDLVTNGLTAQAFPHQTGSPLVDGLLARLPTPEPVIAVLNSRFLQDQPRWVVKGCLDDRGRSVHVGPSLPPERWQTVIVNALRDDGQSHGAQRYVPHERSDGQYISQAYFLVDGRPAGWFSRISRNSVTNVGNGGALLIPVLVG
jgi:hypothetical protein